MKKESDAIKKELEGYVPTIVTFQQGSVWIGSERMDPTEIGAIASECKLLKEMRIWRIFQEKVRYNAIENMMLADTMEKMKEAKMILKELNDLNIIVDNFILEEKKLPRVVKPNVSKST